ncbi:AAA domain-containing protein [Campylobacter jejuni]|uniref:McrB family protein n=1 Tax=Campylobacter jejuni TaxID=197 RepID=UPI000B400689|nr:AAA family ATPase [Campylobacter jejuni]EAI4946423.1 AAA family ATPase [Campylobacter jejuni]EAK1927902.1 AAA family ATPase [Campylobacter jejuni]EAL7562728.1 AAA family ATPase [Campylobacter jejuni]ECK8977695.1 AAA family ATPase [Campylobacter jejuni]EDP4300670.1 AAA domain-containing protein [Campylobacter jejuni]
MIEFLNEDRKKFKEYLIDFFHNAYNSDKLSSKDEIVNFDFLKNYGFCVKLSYGKGTISKIPWIIFIRTDTQEYKASYGIYVYCGIKRENGEIIVCIGESEDKTINYLAKNKVDDYNTQFNKKTYDYKNLNNDIDLIIDKIIENMQWFAKLPLNEIQDRNDLSKSNNKEIRNDGSEMSNKKENKNLSLNQILYGPPGTGKTYHTIDKALEIISKEEKIQIPSEDDRINRKKLFDEYVKNGQIVFTTFHQSYGYEEFVEGIKPIIDNDENSQEVKYDVKDGIFKELCDKSLKNYILSMQNENEIDLDKLIFEFANYINQDFLNKGNEFPLENKVSIKKILLNSKDEYRSFLLGGSIKSPQRLTIDIIKRDYLNFKNKKILSFKDIKPKYDSQSDYHGNAIYYFMFYNKLKEFENIQNEKFKIKKEILKSYIIIIDEINRGNVSKIFGELITLIEPSKRIGEKEELKVKLPYSGEEFGVPKNVYIIGTMNTADRSITSLDTALRRRFEFIEMMPDVSKLSMDCEGINLQELLKAINTRIEYLLDREKTIGHAFFIGVENLNDLKKVFQNKIIPLLQEYFYNDYALINAVLNDNGMIFEDKKDDKYLQKIKNLDSVNSERSIYNIASFDDKIWDKIEIYQAIYNDEIANKLKNENE